MGSAFGRLSRNGRMGLEDTSTLSSGDLVWLVAEQDALKGQKVTNTDVASCGTPFVLKVHGAWRSFSHVGFLVRTKAGLDGLLVCLHHRPKNTDTPACTAKLQPRKTETWAAGDRVKSQETVVMLPFHEVLQSGAWESIAISRLSVPLPIGAASLMHACAKESVGQCLNKRVMLVTSQHRRVICNMLVAHALVAAGRVVFVDSKLCGPAKGTSTLLRKATFIDMSQHTHKQQQKQ